MKSYRILTVILLLLTLLSITPKSAYSEEYPVSPTVKWLSMSDSQQYSEYLAMLKAYDAIKIESDRLFKITGIQKTRIDLLLKEIEKLEKEKNKIDNKYGVSFGINGGIDTALNITVETNIGFYMIFLNRFFINPGVALKLYDEIGGGLSLSVGFFW
jgi:hypothetical protein